MEGTMDLTDRKLDAPEETLNLNAHVVDQELGDEKVAEGLAHEVVGQEPPILSGSPARVVKVSVSADRVPIWETGALDGGLRCVARAVQTENVSGGQRAERAELTCRWK